MALSRTLVRLRNEVAAIVSRPLGERDVEPLYQLGNAETLRRLLTEEYGTGGGHQYGSDRMVTPALGRLVGSAPTGGFAGGASTSAVSFPAPLWGGRRFFISSPVWG